VTLKEILDSVLLESGMGTETAYATNSDEAYQRLVNLANRSADYLSSTWPWQRLRKTYTFTLTDAEGYPLPDDFRELIPDTAFADSYVSPVDMRTDASAWRYMQTNGTSTGPRYRFRLLGGEIKVHSPSVGDTVSFEYVSDLPVRGDDGSEKRRFTADLDTWVLDDELLITDILWRHMRLLGMPDWQDHRAESNRRKTLLQGVEAGSKTIVGGDYAEPTGEPYTDLWVDN